MESAESQECTVLKDDFYNDPSQLSQLLRKRAGSDRPFAFTDSTIYSHSVNSTLPGAPQHTPAIAPRREAGPRRVRTGTRHVRPSLPKHNTAPTSTGFMMEGGGAGKMFQTFDGVMDAPGDTQPDSQMFRQYTSGIVDSKSSIVPSPQPMLGAIEELSADPPTDDPEPGDSSQLQHSPTSPTITSPTVINDDPETQFGFPDLVTSPFKFETPAVAGRKRDNQGQVLSSAMRTNTTPGTVLSASAFFGFGNGGNSNTNGMSLTQAFNATQAGTSPLVGAPNEDLVFQRPSPNFARARHSSPPAAMSSPLKTSVRTDPVTDPVLRSSSEPRADYETMKQSQERRKHQLGDEHKKIGAQDSWDEPIVQQHSNKRKAKERRDQESAQSPTSASVLSPSGRPRRKRGLVSMSAAYQRPEQTRAQGRLTYDGMQNSDADEDSLDELSQPTPVNAHHDEDSLDELSQDIVVTPRASRTHVGLVKDGRTEYRVQVPNTSSHPPRTLSGRSMRNPSQPPSPSLQTRNRAETASQSHHRSITKLRSSRESEVIADSQPSATAEVNNAPRTKLLRFPSSPSINQYSINQTVMYAQTGHTSPPVSSSIPPIPPRSSSQEPKEAHDEDKSPARSRERVPSSPPIVSQEDIIYDEHAYDEHFEREDQSRDIRSTNEDVYMDDDDGLPVAQGKVTEARDVDIEVQGKAIADINVKVNKTNANGRSDDEVQETLVPGNPPNLHSEEEELIRLTHEFDDDKESPKMPPRIQRQSTVPETDMLDDTQPSFFPETEGSPEQESHIDVSTNANGTNSTGAFHTGKEHQSTPLSETSPNSSLAEESTSMHLPGGPTVRSLLDIAKQPNTQHSTELDNIDMPQLSFATDPDETVDIMAGSSPARQIKKRKVTYTKKTLRSPIKESGQPSSHASSSPLKQTLTQQREELGALAAVRAREEAVLAQPATLKSRARVKTELLQTPRKGALKPVKKTMLSKPTGRTPSKSVLQESIADENPTPSIEAVDADTEMRDADDQISEADSIARSVPDSREEDVASFITFAAGEAPTGEILLPNRVFAGWPGLHFHPATCLGRGEGRKLRIRFDDGTIHDTEPAQVRALDLRVGDQAKVDIKGMKQSVYTVVGFKDKIDIDDAEEYPLTDRYGYATIVLEPKQRESLPPLKEQSKEHIDVLVSNIYLTNLLWVRMRDRSFSYTPLVTPSAPASRIGTPTGQEYIPTSTFPRQNTAKPSLLRDSTIRGASVASSTRSGGNIFLNMAFAISLTNDSSSKAAIVKSITSNGGVVLDDGFHELFNVNSLHATVLPEGPVDVVSGLDGLLLKREYKDLGFVALISDSYSRRTKYVQALALNLPCLHLRWIYDSVEASQALPIAKFLLPAGLSTHLDPAGVVRSRTMTIYNPTDENITFIQMLKDRDLLLRGQSVLLITGKSKKELERKQPYIFLTHALGPADVAQCKDLASAKELIKSGGWDWVYADGGVAAVEDATSYLLGKAKTVPSKTKGDSKKRKRGESVEGDVLARSGMKGGKKVTVACDEFVIQSLILGALVEE